MNRIVAREPPDASKLLADYLNNPSGVLQLLTEENAAARRDLAEALRHFPSVERHLAEIFARHGYDQSCFPRVLQILSKKYPVITRIDAIATFVRTSANIARPDLIEAQMQEIVRLVRAALQPIPDADSHGMIDSRKRKSDAKKTLAS